MNSFQNPPIKVPLLNPGEVHIWSGTLDITALQLASCVSTLSPDESQRAARFALERDRHRFIAGRGMLRALLSRYLHADPASLRFAYGPRGKPALAQSPQGPTDPAPSPPLHFNLAHSDNLILVAVTCECPIGIDVEKLRDSRRPDEIAPLCLSPQELATLQSLPEQQRSAAFFTLWTRKEAVLKATGEGIANMAQLDLASLHCPAPPSSDLHSAPSWTLLDLDPSPGFAAAFAAPKSNLQVSCWHWAIS